LQALGEVEGLIAAEITRITKEGLTEEEFGRARNQIIAEHEMRLQDNAGLAMSAALNEIYGLGYDYDSKTRKRIEAVTPEQLQAAAAAILTTNRMAVSIVLPDGKAK
jgi:zinc protease